MSFSTPGNAVGFYARVTFLLLAFCVLAKGYSVIPGGPCLLYTTQNDIRLANTSRATGKVLTIVRDLSEGAALDFYYEGQTICWTDGELEMIQCVHYNATYVGEKVGVITTGLISPDGLAIDWWTKKLYWTDGETNRIEVSSITGEYRKVLFWSDIDQPRAIALVPMKSIMFWTDWGEVPKIERAGMNGDPTTRKVIVSENIFWPNGITVDYENELVYWLDGKLRFIEVMNYDGHNRRAIVKENLLYPFALTIFQNKIYWTDWQTWSIHVYDKTMKMAPRELIHSDVVPMGIHTWDPRRQPKGDHPCKYNNGNCTHLCLLSPLPPGYSCACPTGVKLLDSFRCAAGPQELLLLVQRTDISRISLDSPDFTNFVLPLTGIKHAIAIDYDLLDGYLYWTDDEVHAIRRARLDGTGQEDLVVSEVKHPDGVAIDWLARNMYWTDTGTDRIEVARLNGTSRKVLINEGLVEPRAIALAPQLGWMFWSDWNEAQPKIERASLDGSERVVLVSSDLGWPNGIALDLETQKMYWCDAKNDIIEVSNMDGSDRRALLSDSLPHVFGLTLLGDYLYWTDWQRRSIDRVHKTTGLDRQVIVDQLPNLMGLKAVRLGELKGTNQCAKNNGGCSHLCLNRPKDYVCACQIGHELAKDQKTCVVPAAFLLFARKESIERISIENEDNDVIVPVKDVRDASALDIDMADSRIYWSDVKIRTISRAYMNGSDVERIVELGLVAPEGLAVDWMAHNVYWSDSEVHRIEVARLDGSSRRVLIWKGLEEPRNLALDPRKGVTPSPAIRIWFGGLAGASSLASTYQRPRPDAPYMDCSYMYWSEWRTVVIKRSGMDGSDQSVIVTSTGHATGLTVDHEARRLLWAAQDPASIESADLDGSHRRTLVGTDVHMPYGLTQYGDYVFWSDWNTGDIECVNKTTGFNRTRIHRHLEYVTALLVFHASRQSGTNQCRTNNGGCSHLCLALPSSTGSKHRCGCPTHYTLDKDNVTCIAPKSFLIFSQRNSFGRLMPDSKDCPDAVLPVLGLKNVRAIEYDPMTQYVYWVDGRTQSIKRAFSNGSSVSLVVGGAQHPFDLALDPLGRLLFWSCSGTDTINVTRLDNGSSVGVVVRNDQEKPRSIAVHSIKRLLFWTDVGIQSCVVQARMDGANRVVLASGLSDLVALAVDPDNDLVFWAHSKQIDVSDLNGKNKRTLVSTQLIQVSTMATLDSYLYWLDREQQQVERIHIITGEERRTELQRMTHLTDLVAVRTINHKVIYNHTCSRFNQQGHCSHLCVWSEASQDDVCACPMGLMLHEDMHTCGAHPACGPSHFTCGSTGMGGNNKDCIPLSWRCDGHKDCPQGSDEVGCPACRPDQFRCMSGQCIELAWVCDGTTQCPDAHDEASCCKRPQDFQCAVNGVCIPATSLCDGWEHCADGADESPALCAQANNRRSENATGDSDKHSYIIGILVTMGVVVLVGLTFYYCRKRLAQNTNVQLNDQAGDPLSPRINMPDLCPKSGRSCKLGALAGNEVRMSALKSNSSSSNSYDRNHITGASSSTTNGSSMACYPRETLNPPPSPATTANSTRCSSSTASRYRPYRHYRSINQPPPPTPCSTDVCDESDSNYPSRYRYDSEPFPPPPTPRSHYHSDAGILPESCPPSPSSRSSTYFSPLPPPPSPVPSPPRGFNS